MKGIQFLVDDKGNRRSVLIDLKNHRQLPEDLYDRLIAQSRVDEPRETLEQVKRRLRRRGKLRE